MPVNYFKQNKHLFWRAGFGPMIEDYKNLQTIEPKVYFKAILKASALPPKPIVVSNKVDYGYEDEMMMESKVSPAQRLVNRKQSAVDLRSLNIAWCNEMVNSQQQLLEKMSLFWHGHFATRVINIFYQEQYLQIIRANALGNFATLLKEISKSASMLNFLNNNKNTKRSPNENFAREIMELFTLGAGNYTEADIKNSARAFTGWDNKENGEFVFNANKHDEGEKTFLNKTGSFNGDDIIEIILAQKQTAIFIATKLYKFMVNENVNKNHIDQLANKFFDSKYDITVLLTEIFTSSWFYNEENIGTKIKSPLEFLIGMQRNITLQYQNPGAQLVFQKVLGQILLYPPNVAGWPGGKNWIDSSTLIARLKLPQTLIYKSEFGFTPKDDDDVMMGMQDGAASMATEKQKHKKIAEKAAVDVTINWLVYCNQFEKVERVNLLNAVTNFLLQPQQLQTSTNTMQKFINQSSRNEFIQSATLVAMSLPEYQLC